MKSPGPTVAIVLLAVGLGSSRAIGGFELAPHRDLPVVSGGGAVAMLSDAVEVKMTYVDVLRGRPPSSTVFFDATISNREDEPRWVLFPALISPASQSSGGGVSGLEVYEFGGRGRVLMGHFFGNGGFNAILLPAGAEVTLRRLPIKYWDTVPRGSLPVTLVFAARISIDGDDAEAWFGGSASSDQQADVAADRGTRLGSRHSPGSKELAVTFQGRSSVTIDVSAGP